MYTLFYSPGSASMVVHLVLLEAGALHELRQVDLEQGAQRDAEYLKLNPNGVVPTLLIDGTPHYEAAALVLLLAERHPEASLAPALDSDSRGNYLQWMLHLANTLQPAFRLWFYPGDIAGVDADAVKAAARTRIEACWARLDQYLASQSGHYCLGISFSALDLYATMLMRWSRNMPKPATEWPHLSRLAQAIRARPSWQRLYAIEGLTEWA
ncbi:MAG: glutathione S-transferase [Tahibacter sp.]